MDMPSPWAEQWTLGAYVHCCGPGEGMLSRGGWETRAREPRARETQAREPRDREAPAQESPATESTLQALPVGRHGLPVVRLAHDVRGPVRLDRWGAFRRNRSAG